ncbi:hypothetical protein PR048_023049 [Dryococelus australis]|uniref:Uncharacterized protein n=1 Tax=Dryococelus australis TaxID=614101 RepID=A0ABQ9GSZ9_9NEOP|nr:hypothetical protein PR048_023049 [Dryococelus australis]
MSTVIQKYDEEAKQRVLSFRTTKNLAYKQIQVQAEDEYCCMQVVGMDYFLDSILQPCSKRRGRIGYWRKDGIIPEVDKTAVPSTADSDTMPPPHLGSSCDFLDLSISFVTFHSPQPSAITTLVARVPILRAVHLTATCQTTSSKQRYLPKCPLCLFYYLNQQPITAHLSGVGREGRQWRGNPILSQQLIIEHLIGGGGAERGRGKEHIPLANHNTGHGRGLSRYPIQREGLRGGGDTNKFYEMALLEVGLRLKGLPAATIEQMHLSDLSELTALSPIQHLIGSIGVHDLPVVMQGETGQTASSASDIISTTTSRPTCQRNEFQCSDGSCIDKTQLCNSYDDCSEGEDESNCDVRCRPDIEWRCDSGTCIDARLRCNGRIECPADDSDERNCQYPGIQVRCIPTDDETETAEAYPQDICILMDIGIYQVGPKRPSGYSNAEWGHSGSVARVIQSGAAVVQWIERSQKDLKWGHRGPVARVIPSRAAGAQWIERSQWGCSGPVARVIPSRASGAQWIEIYQVGPQRPSGRSDSKWGRSGSFCMLINKFVLCCLMYGSTAPRCNSGQFRCRDGSCIDANLRCDNKIDCPRDNHDEEYCRKSNKNLTRWGTDLVPAFAFVFTRKQNEWVVCHGAEISSGQVRAAKCIMSQVELQTYINFHQKLGQSTAETLQYARVRWTHRTHSIPENPESQQCGYWETPWRPSTVTLISPSCKNELQKSTFDPSEGFGRLTSQGQISDSRTQGPGSGVRTDHQPSWFCQPSCPSCWMSVTSTPRDERLEPTSHHVMMSRNHHVGPKSPEQSQGLSREHYTIRNWEGIGKVSNAHLMNSYALIMLLVSRMDFVVIEELTVQMAQMKLTVPPCRTDEFRCGDGTCLNINQRCNGNPDCLNGEDEEGCVVCSPTEFKCKDGGCVDLRVMCDGNQDCGDASDEDECGGVVELFCHSWEWPCKDTETCISREKHCDGFPDCFDDSDEVGCEDSWEAAELLACSDFSGAKHGGSEASIPPAAKESSLLFWWGTADVPAPIDAKHCESPLL